MGREYVIDHIISALNQENKEKAYQLYVAECMRISTKNTAIIAQILSDGKSEATYVSASYLDILDNAKPEETRTADEIKGDFLEHFGRKEVDAE